MNLYFSTRSHHLILQILRSGVREFALSKSDANWSVCVCMRSTTGRPFSVREGRFFRRAPIRSVDQNQTLTARTADVFAYFSADARTDANAHFHRSFGIPARFSLYEDR